MLEEEEEEEEEICLCKHLFGGDVAVHLLAAIPACMYSSSHITNQVSLN